MEPVATRWPLWDWAGMTGLRLLLAGGWLAIAAVTVWALVSLGLRAAAESFVGDLAHPWRAQFYLDLELHLLVFAAWIVWREPSRARGAAFALLTMVLGALFTLPYLIVAAARSGGDIRALLTGQDRKPAVRAPPSAAQGAFAATFTGPALRRSLLVAVLVGSMLNAINQGDALLGAGDVVLWKLFLTFVVPFAVASYGSYAALRQQQNGPRQPLDATEKQR